MAKMPTLNVDVAVNTKTMQKGIAEANKQLQQIGGKGLAAAGGTAAKLGSFGSLGGGLGQLALGAGGVMLAASAPFKIAKTITQAYTDSVQDGIKALDAWNKGALEGVRTGIGRPMAERLAAGEAQAASATGAFEGMGAAFFGAAMNDQGELGGAVGAVTTWAEEMGRGTKTVLASLGAFLSGKSAAEADVAALMAAEPENADRLRFMQEGAEKGKTWAYGGVDDPTESMLRARALWKERMQTQELLG